MPRSSPASVQPLLDTSSDGESTASRAWRVLNRGEIALEMSGSVLIPSCCCWGKILSSEDHCSDPTENCLHPQDWFSCPVQRLESLPGETCPLPAPSPGAG